MDLGRLHRLVLLVPSGGAAVDLLVVIHLEGDFGMNLKISQHLSEAVKSLSHFHVLSATLHYSCSTNLQYIEDVYKYSTYLSQTETLNLSLPNISIQYIAENTSKDHCTSM